MKNILMVFGNRLENDGRLEDAQQMAGHESPRTTLRPHKGRDYTEVMGANPAVTFDFYAALAQLHKARLRSESFDDH